jgi:glycosyltransferase involved in cell wall biosynthesis
MIVSVLYVVLSGLKFDLVIATSPQFFCGLAGKYISKIKNRPFILEIRDLWPESIVAVGAMKNKILIKFLEGIELRLYKSAELIISVTNSFKENLIRRGIDKKKIHTIYNGVSTDIFNNYSPITNDELKEYLNEGFKVGYIGTIGMAHSVITFIEAASLSVNDQIKFVIIGSGAEREKLELEIMKRGLKNIRIFPLQPKNEIPAIIKQLDIFVVHLKKQDLFKTVIPSKMFEGMIMKKPILIGVDGEARKIVDDAKCGLYFQPENSTDMIEKVKYLRNNSKKSELMGINGYNMVLKNFDRNFLASEFKDLIFKLIK